MFTAEQQPIPAAVGLAACRYVPFASTFAVHFSRAHDFLRIAGISGANITLCRLHAGVEVGPDGPSQMRQCAVGGLPGAGTPGELMVAAGISAPSITAVTRNWPPAEQTREAAMSADVRICRVYDDPSPGDGTRVLVDGVWPRGMRKDAARLDEWAKDAAPSAELRTWYGHDPAKFEEFRRRYIAELAEPGPAEAVSRLRALAEKGPVTLLTATKDVSLSQAAVLAGLLREAR